MRVAMSSQQLCMCLFAFLSVCAAQTVLSTCNVRYSRSLCDLEFTPSFFINNFASGTAQNPKRDTASARPTPQVDDSPRRTGPLTNSFTSNPSSPEEPRFTITRTLGTRCSVYSLQLTTRPAVSAKKANAIPLFQNWSFLLFCLQLRFTWRYICA